MVLGSTSSTYTLTLLAFFVLFLYFYFSQKFSYCYWKKRNVAYFKPSPVVGNFFDVIFFRTTIGEYLAKLYNETKEPFFGIFVFHVPYLIIRSPELIKHMLVKDFKNFDNRAVANNPEHEHMISNMLFFVKNPDWRKFRNKISPVFTTGKLKGMVPLINDCGKSLNKYLETKTSEESTEARQICLFYSVNVIASCAYGVDAHCFEDEDAVFRKAGKMMYEFTWSNSFQQIAHFFLPNLVKLFNLTFFPTPAISFLRDFFWETINIREAKNHKVNDLIGTIINIRNSEDTRKELNFEGDRAICQATQFFAAGFETTSSTMSFTLYELAIHPEIQEKVRGEIRSCLQQYGGFTYEALQNMKFLHMCVQEALRKYPVLPFLDRRCNEDYKIPDSDVIIEKGTPVFIPMFGIHYDPQYFPDPEKFDPDRFSEDNISKITPYTYIPFGQGPRNCVGERFGVLGAKLGLAHILNEFQVEASNKTPPKIKLQIKSLLVASDGGIPVKFRKLST